MLAWAERVKHRFTVGEDLRPDRTVARIMSGNSSYGRHALSKALSWHDVPLHVTTWLLVDNLKVKHWRTTWRRMWWENLKRRIRWPK